MPSTVLRAFTSSEESSLRTLAKGIVLESTIKAACQVYRRVLCGEFVLRSGEQPACSSQKVSGFAAEL